MIGFRKLRGRLTIPVLMVSIGALLSPIGAASVAAPAASTGSIAEVRSFPTSDHGVRKPAGIAWSDAQASLVIAESTKGATALHAVTPDETSLGDTTIAEADGSTLAVDPSDGRVTLLSGDRLLSVPGGSLRGEQRRAEGRVEGTLSVQDVDGAAYDEAGLVLLTDEGLTRVVDGRVGGRTAVGIPAGHDLRGLATNRQTGDLYTYDATANQVVALGQDGAPTRTYDTSELGLVDVQGLAFGPSADATDDPAIQSLYIADAGSPSGSGLVMEASLDVTAAAAALAEVQATQVRRVATSAYNPPSPDPSGVAYIPDTDRLFIDDGEVEEMPIYQGANFFSTTRSGGLVDTGTSLPWSKEPTGAGYNPANKHLYISDDSAREIWEVTSGGDGRFGTGDDVVTHFDTAVLGSGDPEGVEYEGPTNSVWIIDGVNREVYRKRAGSDGRFGTSDDVNSQFDVNVFGLTDPEGIAYDSVRDTMVVLDDNSNRIYEFTKDGALINIIDFTAVGMVNAAGLAIAPSSTGSGARNYFVVARGRDNDNYPDENDGELVELNATLPPIGGGPVNQAPTVSAGSDQSVVLPSSASLDGTVTDDGLPNPPGATTVVWSEVSGPGTVTFGNAAAVDTTASFSAAGTYVLRLTADDGALTAADEVTVNVSAAAVNQAPTVSAGSDQSVVLPSSASLDGTVTDDGLPNPPGATTVVWSQVSGPDTVTFGNAAAVDTTASFSAAGTYVLRLTADDGALAAADEVTVTVSSGSGGGTTQTVEVRVAAGSDDAEQRVSGSTNVVSADLELTTDGTTQQVVGTRFAGLAVPRGATVTNAYVQFQVDEVSTGAVSLTIKAEDADNAPTYQATSRNLTNRATTAASVTWTPPDWNTRGQAAAGQRTPNLAALVQAVVNRAGWAQGNALALQISGTGRRTAVSYNGTPSAAPLLHVEYTTGSGGGPVNQAPTVSAGTDQSVVLPSSASLDGTVTDDGLPSSPGQVTTTWSTTSGPGSVTFGNAAEVDTTASFSAAGTYVLRLTADDGALIAADEVTVTVSSGSGGGTPQTFEVRVAASTDDAEQRVAGGMDLTSSDLELTTDGSRQQVVGMRFAGLAIPKGATVTNAYLQFQTDEVSTGAVSLTIRAEAADNAPTYEAISGSMTARATTAASVAWVPPDWNTVGEAGAAQRTPNLAALVQAVLNRSGWAQGNALALQISGTGRRTAEAFEGVPTAAPLLHIEYTIG